MPTDQSATVAEPLEMAVYRKARKPWRCTCADPASNNYGGGVVMCQRSIRPGDTYVEHLGDSGSYQSGVRYCLPCGVATWRRSLWSGK
jgi:hypothetical protein